MGLFSFLKKKKVIANNAYCPVCEKTHYESDVDDGEKTLKIIDGATYIVTYCSRECEEAARLKEEKNDENDMIEFMEPNPDDKLGQL